MYRLAHISDIHLGPLPEFPLRKLFSKRITGYVNWRRNRKRHHLPDTTERIIRHMLSARADDVAITGDLINLGLEPEMVAAVDWLETLGEPERNFVVCGNHDAYVPGALPRALAHWQPWVTDDERRVIEDETDYPVVRRRGDIVLIGCNSGEASAPFFATGRFRSAQATKLADILDREGRAGSCRVIMIHHPPVRNSTPFHKRLIGASLLRGVVAQFGAELVLHGHTHLDTVLEIAKPGGTVPVVGVPSAGESGGNKKPAARYNLFNIAKGPNGWSIAMQEYGTTPESTEVTLVRKRQLA